MKTPMIGMLAGRLTCVFGTALVLVCFSGVGPPVAAAPQAGPPTPLGVQDSDLSGVQVALLEVKRTSGDTVTVRWEYRNKGPKKQELQGVLSEADRFKLAGAAYLVDPVNRKKYLIIKDEKGTPLGGRLAKSSVLPNDSVSTWAKFPAPPAAVDKVTVYLPHAAPFDDVPLK